MNRSRLTTGLAAVALGASMVLTGCSDDEPTDDPDIINPDDGAENEQEPLPEEEPLPEDDGAEEGEPGEDVPGGGDEGDE